MKIKNVNLEVVCGITSKLPDMKLPEISILGRSNVGKSSFVNTLINRKYAKVSQSPGKTQTINYYNINEEFYLVDLPGYGYAKVSKDIRLKWGKMIERYLLNSKQLKFMFLLIDIRHKPTEDDKMMYEWLRYNNIKTFIIATKLDKISRSSINKNISIIKKELNDMNVEVIPFSSLKKSGIDDVLNLIKREIDIDYSLTI